MKKNMVCNKCGRKIKEKNGILVEDVFEGKKEWGYFSKRDLQVDLFYLCEECYDKITHDFLIPVKRKKKKEVM